MRESSGDHQCRVLYRSAAVGNKEGSRFRNCHFVGNLVGRFVDKAPDKVPDKERIPVGKTRLP